MRHAQSIQFSAVSKFGERTRPRVPGSAPSLNPPADVSDEGVADDTRWRVFSPMNLPKPSLFLKLEVLYPAGFATFYVARIRALAQFKSIRQAPRF
jgi:hypothetical protein